MTSLSLGPDRRAEAGPEAFVLRVPSRWNPRDMR
jgi:hypothetical protein